MKATDRVRISESIESATKEQEWDVISMVLKAFGLKPVSFGRFEEEWTVFDSLGEATEDQLLELAEHYRISPPEGIGLPTASVHEHHAEAVKFFGSHLAVRKAQIHEFKT